MSCARSAIPALFALALGACAAPNRLQPFASDGCSLFPDRALAGNADWCSCCLAHDLAYWRGGTAQERLAADEALASCIVDRTGDRALAALMFEGVRAGGQPGLPTGFRWGYGWPRGRGYRALSTDEAAEAARLEREFRLRPAATCGMDASAGSDPPAAG